MISPWMKNGVMLKVIMDQEEAKRRDPEKYNRDVKAGLPIFIGLCIGFLIFCKVAGWYYGY
jgi:hypothetical protein